MDPVKDDALDRELSRALGVNPSPEFVARVRTRIASEPAPAAAWWSWKLVTTGALAAAVVIAVVVSRPGRQTATKPEVVQAQRPVAPLATAPRIEGLVGADLGRPHPSVPEVTRASSSGRASSAPTNAAGIEPEILFDPRETMALQRLIAGVSDGRVDLTPLTAQAPPAPMELQPIADLVIAPLTIEPLAPASGAQGERQ